MNITTITVVIVGAALIVVQSRDYQSKADVAYRESLAGRSLLDYQGTSTMHVLYIGRDGGQGMGTGASGVILGF